MYFILLTTNTKKIRVELKNYLDLEPVTVACYVTWEVDFHKASQLTQSNEAV